MTDSYPKKYWWLILVVVPVVIAAIAIMPNFISSNGGGGGGNNISIDGSSVDGDVQIIGTQVILNQMQSLSLEATVEQEIAASITRANNLIESGFYQDAIPLLESVAGQLKTPAVYNNLGSIYLLENRDEDALEAFKEGLAIDPAYQPIHVKLGQLYKKQGKIQEAVTQLKKAPDEPQSSTLLKTIQQEIGTGDLEQEPNNDILQPNLAPLGKNILGSVTTKEDTDFFKFSIPAPPRDIYAIHVRNLSTDLKLQIALLDSDKKHLWSNATYHYQVTNGQDVRHSFSASSDTTYLLSIGSLAAAGDYNLLISATRSFDAFEPNDNGQQAADTVVGKALDANLMDEDDRDFYRVTSTETSLRVSITNKSATLHPQLKILDGDKSHIWSNAEYHYQVTAGQDVDTSFKTKPGESYYVSVSSLEGSGKYSLEIKPE